MARMNFGLDREALRELMSMPIGAVYDPEYQRQQFERRLEIVKAKMKERQSAPTARAPGPTQQGPPRRGIFGGGGIGTATPLSPQGFQERQGALKRGGVGLMERRQQSQAQPGVARPPRGPGQAMSLLTRGEPSGLGRGLLRRRGNL